VDHSQGSLHYPEQGRELSEAEYKAVLYGQETPTVFDPMAARIAMSQLHAGSHYHLNHGGDATVINIDSKRGGGHFGQA